MLNCVQADRLLGQASVTKITLRDRSKETPLIEYIRKYKKAYQNKSPSKPQRRTFGPDLEAVLKHRECDFIKYNKENTNETYLRLQPIINAILSYYNQRQKFNHRLSLGKMESVQKKIICESSSPCEKDPKVQKQEQESLAVMKRRRPRIDRKTRDIFAEMLFLNLTFREKEKLVDRLLENIQFVGLLEKIVDRRLTIEDMDLSAQIQLLVNLSRILQKEHSPEKIQEQKDKQPNKLQAKDTLKEEVKDQEMINSNGSPGCNQGGVSQIDQVPELSLNMQDSSMSVSKQSVNKTNRTQEEKEKQTEQKDETELPFANVSDGILKEQESARQQEKPPLMNRKGFILRPILNKKSTLGYSSKNSFESTPHPKSTRAPETQRIFSGMQTPKLKSKPTSILEKTPSPSSNQKKQKRQITSINFNKKVADRPKTTVVSINRNTKKPTNNNNIRPRNPEGQANASNNKTKPQKLIHKNTILKGRISIASPAGEQRQPRDRNQSSFSELDSVISNKELDEEIKNRRKLKRQIRRGAFLDLFNTQETSPLLGTDAFNNQIEIKTNLTLSQQSFILNKSPHSTVTNSSFAKHKKLRKSKSSAVMLQKLGSNCQGLSSPSHFRIQLPAFIGIEKGSNLVDNKKILLRECERLKEILNKYSENSPAKNATNVYAILDEWAEAMNQARAGEQQFKNYDPQVKCELVKQQQCDSFLNSLHSEYRKAETNFAKTHPCFQNLFRFCSIKNDCPDFERLDVDYRPGSLLRRTTGNLISSIQKEQDAIWYRKLKMKQDAQFQQRLQMLADKSNEAMVLEQKPLH